MNGKMIGVAMGVLGAVGVGGVLAYQAARTEPESKPAAEPTPEARPAAPARTRRAGQAWPEKEVT